MSLDQLREQVILPGRGPSVVVELFPLSQFLERHPGQQHGLQTQSEVRRQGVQPQKVMQPRHLANKTIVPLYVVDVLDAALNIGARADEPIPVRESDLSQDLVMSRSGLTPGNVKREKNLRRTRRNASSRQGRLCCWIPSRTSPTWSSAPFRRPRWRVPSFASRSDYKAGP